MAAIDTVRMNEEELGMRQARRCSAPTGFMWVERFAEGGVAVIPERAPQHHPRALRKKFGRGRDAMFVYLSRRVAVPRHDRGILVAGRAPPAGVSTIQRLPA